MPTPRSPTSPPLSPTPDPPGPPCTDARDLEDEMAAHAGERAEKTGDFYCASCDEKVHVTAGDKIPTCPNGHKQFETRRNEPGNK
ncbi:zinc ribbon-containing protein [Promicromonospora umidemergens]|nr:hypothetical protein [Promicromonospora umidemergens]